MILFYFWRITDSTRRLSYCVWRRAVLTPRVGPALPFAYVSPFSCITFLRQFNNEDEPGSSWGTCLVKRQMETLPCCECMNITRPHALAVCCFSQRRHRLLQRDFSYVPTERSCFVLLFLFWLIIQDFFYFCIWLLTNLEGTFTGQACTKCTSWQSTSLPFLCFAIENVSTVSHCHSLWQ